MNQLNEKFPSIKPDPMKHLISAKSFISELINANLSVFGEGHEVTYLLCQAQSEINNAIQDLNKLQEVK